MCLLNLFHLDQNSNQNNLSKATSFTALTFNPSLELHVLHALNRQQFLLLTDVQQRNVINLYCVYYYAF